MNSKFPINATIDFEYSGKSYLPKGKEYISLSVLCDEAGEVRA